MTDKEIKLELLKIVSIPNGNIEATLIEVKKIWEWVKS